MIHSHEESNASGNLVNFNFTYTSLNKFLFQFSYKTRDFNGEIFSDDYKLLPIF